MVGSPASYISHRRRFAFISLSAMVYRTPQEKMLIVHTHKYFLAEGQQRLDPLGRAVRERVAKSLAVSESMVARVLAAYNVHGEEGICGARGCPPRSEVENYREFITEIINDHHSMREELVRMDVSYIRGCNRDPRADSKKCILGKKLAILSARLVPKLTEVYLDESYCNVYHVAGGAYVEQRPPHLRYLAPAPTMEELQDLAGEASDKVHCSNIMGEKDQR
ncbi:hypothetical protein GQ600_18958 [Phytophthora cactorum]|nr:hypothetical protein GQ600_18958 [Phytophthora cactorum]